MPKCKKNLFRLLPAIVFVFMGWDVYSGQTGIFRKIKNDTAPFDEKKIDQPLLVSGPMVMVKSRYQGGIFYTETRKDKIERYKCSQCHNNKEVKIARAAEIAHGHIKLAHGAREKKMSCFTCHKKDERDFLNIEENVRIDMDHSYQMCGQCHFRQKKDWIGGAHGKRIDYWAGQRVVKNCTSCHDPHSPRFEKRWPKTYSLPIGK